VLHALEEEQFIGEVQTDADAVEKAEELVAGITDL
jgi:hypothetical protein